MGEPNRRGRTRPSLPTRLLPAWRDAIGPVVTLPEPPAALDTIEEPADRQRGREAWLAAQRFLAVLRCWRDWRRQLRSAGDADPGLAGRYRDAAAGALRALAALGVNVPVLAAGDAGPAIALLPPVPSGLNAFEVPEPDGAGGWTVRRFPAWQEDTEFLAALWDAGREARLVALEAELGRLVEMLKTYPGAALARHTASCSTDFLDPDLAGLQPLVRRLVEHMLPLDAARLEDVARAVWEKDAADVSDNAWYSAIRKANAHLGASGHRLLSREGELLRRY